MASGVVESKNISDVLYFSGKIERNKSPEAALSVARHAWNPALSRWDGKGACYFTLFKTQSACLVGRLTDLAATFWSPLCLISEGVSK